MIPLIDPTDMEVLDWFFMHNKGMVSLVDRLLQDPRFNPSIYEDFPIRASSTYGHREVVARLLQDSRVDPTAHNNEAIRNANHYGYHEIVELLQSYGCVLPAPA